MQSDTGGGHRASAQAIKAGFEALYGNKFVFDIVDMWTEHTYFPFNNAASSYSFMAGLHPIPSGPSLHDFLPSAAR